LKKHCASSEAEITFSKVVVFSDGCAAQYKGKGTFGYLSLKSIHVEWNYFGSDHGKSECDGEVGASTGLSTLLCWEEGRQFPMQRICIHGVQKAPCAWMNPDQRRFFLVKKET
jgi:hypothetical protein